jgi:hypothetical protein
MAPGLAAAMNVIPSQLPYGYGRYALTDMIVRWIPRQFWAGKPQPPEVQVTAKVAPPPPGQPAYLLAYSILMHVYLDFGMFGAILIAGLGIFYRTLWEWFMRHRHSEIAMALFAVSLPEMVETIRDGPVDAVFNLVAVAGAVLLAWAVSRSRRPA